MAAPNKISIEEYDSLIELIDCFDNLEQIKEAVKLWHEHGIDSVQSYYEHLLYVKDIKEGNAL